MSVNIVLLLLFDSYSRQETNMISPEGFTLSNSAVYLIKKTIKSQLKINNKNSIVINNFFLPCQ